MAASFDAGSIFVNLRTKTKEFVQGFRRARSAANRFFASIKRGAATITKAGRSMTKFGRTMLTKVTLPLTIAFGLILRAVDKQAKALAQLNAVVRSTGGAAGVTAAHVEDLAASIQKTSRVGDELVIRGAAILLTFTNIRNEGDGMNAVFDRTTRLAVDMSAALDQDLKQSMIQVGKAINDPLIGLTALQRVGVSFTKQQKEQVKALVESNDLLGAQTLILDELEKEFTGVAASLAAKGLGPLAQGLNDLGDSFEAFGEVLAPAITQVGKWISQIAGFLKSLPEGEKRLLLIILAIVAGIGPIVLTLGALATVIGTFVIPGLITLAGALSFLLGPIGLVVLAVTALVALFAALSGKSKTTRRELDLTAESMGGVKEAIDDTPPAFKKFTAALEAARVETENFNEETDQFNLSFGQSLDLLREAARELPNMKFINDDQLEKLGVTRDELSRLRSQVEGISKDLLERPIPSIEFRVNIPPEETRKVLGLFRQLDDDAREFLGTLETTVPIALNRMTIALGKFGSTGANNLEDVTKEAEGLKAQLEKILSVVNNSPELLSTFKEVIEGLESDIESLTQKIIEQAGALPDVKPPPGLSEAQQSLQQSAEDAGNTIGSAIVQGINRGASALEILADLGRRLFETHLQRSIQSLSKLAAVELAKLANTSSKSVEAILNVVIAAIGFILSQLDKGTEIIDSFQSQAAEIQSSQLVRGIVAGPQNVAIAEVNESIASAFVGSEERLDVLIAIGQELIQIFVGGGTGGGTAVPSAGRAQLP